MSRARSAELMRSQAARGALTEYLAIRLANVTHAVEVSMIREIVRPPPITAVPRAGLHVLGIVSIRGRVVTVVDPRVQLALDRTEVTSRSRILVFEVQSEKIGLWVDEVLMVYRLTEGEIERAQGNFSDAPSYIAGVARPATTEGSIEKTGSVDERAFVLLDLRALMFAGRR